MPHLVAVMALLILEPAILLGMTGKTAAGTRLASRARSSAFSFTLVSFATLFSTLLFRLPDGVLTALNFLLSFFLLEDLQGSSHRLSIGHLVHFP